MLPGQKNVSNPYLISREPAVISPHTFALASGGFLLIKFPWFLYRKMTYTQFINTFEKSLLADPTLSNFLSYFR